MRADPRIDQAKAIPIADVAAKLGLLSGLKPAGREKVGSCPSCGGSDRFAIAPDRGVFNCRNCGGGDGIKLVQLTLNIGFLDALSYLVGDKPIDIDPAEQERRRKQREAQEERQASYAAKARARSITMAKEIWREGLPAEATIVRDYLDRRGITRERLPDLPSVIRFHPELRYTEKDGKDWRTIYTGPAMLAAVTEPSGHVIGVHRTWIDPDDPKGKPSITGLDGKPAVVKKMLGSKKGATIRLIAPREHLPVMIMGEGIETTLSAAVASPITGAAYWCGIDLGNMAGRRLSVENPNTGKSSSRFSDLPDLDDGDAFVPPPWLKRLIYLQDGDSAARETRAKLVAGLARARAKVPGLRTQIVHAGAGVDFNDLRRGDDDE